MDAALPERAQCQSCVSWNFWINNKYIEKLLNQLTRINEGNKTEKNGPHEYKEICRKGVVYSWLTPDVFEDVVAMRLYNKIY